MTNGEWLLENHAIHKSLNGSITKRYHRLLENMESSDATIEGMALRVNSWDQVKPGAGGNSQESRTERIALSHMEVEEKQRKEAASELETLHHKLAILASYLDVFDCVMAGLDEMETWIVSEHHLKGRSFRTLSSSKTPDGAIYSTTTLQRRNKGLIEKIDMLILQVNGDFK